MGSFPDRRLIDDDRLVDVRHTFDTIMATDRSPTRIEVIHEEVRQDIDDERGLP